MPVMNGIRATAEIVRIRPDAKVIVMTVVDAPRILAQAIIAGAQGCIVHNQIEPETMIQQLRTIAACQSVILSPLVADALMNHIKPDQAKPAIGDGVTLTSLTQRENEILDLIALGKHNAEIARILGIKERTVKNHSQNVYAKLGLTGRYEAISLKLRYTHQNWLRG